MCKRLRILWVSFCKCNNFFVVAWNGGKMGRIHDDDDDD